MVLTEDTWKEIIKDWSPERKGMELRSVLRASEDYPFLTKMMIRKKFSELLEA